MAGHGNGDEEDRIAKVSDTLGRIPDQQRYLRFELSKNDKLELGPTRTDEDNIFIVETLRSELLAEDGPLNSLQIRYSANPNIPQATLFSPLIDSYRRELAKDVETINFAVLYARGARFYAARNQAKEQVDAGEWPDATAHENECVDAICDTHGPLIMATSVGRLMVSSAYEYDASPEELRQDRLLIEEFGEALASEQDIIEPATALAVRDLTQTVDSDPQPARGRMIGLLAVGSALNVVVGVAALEMGGALAVAVTAGALFFPERYLWEVVKKTDTFGGSVGHDSEKLESLILSAERSASKNQLALMKRMSEFVVSKQALIHRLGGIRPEFGWVRRYVPMQPELIVNMEEERLDFLPQSSPVKAVIAFESCWKLDPSESYDYTRVWLEANFGRNEIRDLCTLSLLEFNRRQGSLLLGDDPMGDYDIIVKNASAKTRTMEIVQSALAKDFDMPPKELGAKIAAEIGREWSDASCQRYGNALKVWGRWIYPHLIDPTKSIYQSKASGQNETVTGPGRQMLEIHPMKKKQVSDLIHQDVSIPAIAKQLGLSIRHVNRAMSEADKVYRQKNPAKRRLSSKPRRKQVQRWNDGFLALPHSERNRLAALWYSTSHLDKIVLPEFERAGAPTGFNRGQLYRLLGPRDASEAPDWYNK